MVRLHERARRVGRRGKLLALFATVDQFHEELEFDFAERGWDLLDFWRGKITLRALAVRIKHLPRESAFVRAVVGGPHYTDTDVLLIVADILAGANWQRGGDKDAPRPKPFPRPGDDKRTQAHADDMRARIAAEADLMRRRGVPI